MAKGSNPGDDLWGLLSEGLRMLLREKQSQSEKKTAPVGPMRQMGSSASAQPQKSSGIQGQEDAARKTSPASPAKQTARPVSDQPQKGSKVQKEEDEMWDVYR